MSAHPDDAIQRDPRTEPASTLRGGPIAELYYFVGDTAREWIEADPAVLVSEEDWR